nr:MAG TPA: hypothetical protein [Caudoviricetes sp.]
MIKVSLYPSKIQSYSATVEISLSFRVRPLASYPCQARMGLIPTNFTVRSDLLFCQSNICHTATLTNFLCYTPVFRIQGKLT